MAKALFYKFFHYIMMRTANWTSFGDFIAHFVPFFIVSALKTGLTSIQSTFFIYVLFNQLKDIFYYYKKNSRYLSMNLYNINICRKILQLNEMTM